MTDDDKFPSEVLTKALLLCLLLVRPLKPAVYYCITVLLYSTPWSLRSKQLFCISSQLPDIYYDISALSWFEDREPSIHLCQTKKRQGGFDSLNTGTFKRKELPAAWLGQQQKSFQQGNITRFQPYPFGLHQQIVCSRVIKIDLLIRELL